MKNTIKMFCVITLTVLTFSACPDGDGGSFDPEPVPCTTHNYEWTLLFYATETTGSVEARTCTVCGSYTGTPRISSLGLEYTAINNGAAYSVGQGSITTGEVIVIAPMYMDKPVTKIKDSTYNSTNGRYDGGFNIPTMTSITIPNSVTSIGEYAFYGCTNLTSITIPNSVTYIGYYAFGGCTSLTSITIPNSVISIGQYAFGGCTGLTSIAIPNNISVISDFAFHGCTSLTSITIPNSVTSIGNSAFYGCTSLVSITIPNSVMAIGQSAFQGCANLASVTIGSGVNAIGNNAFDTYMNFSPVPPNLNVTIHRTTPPALGTGVFYHIQQIQIFVPVGSVTLYQVSTNWSSYNIQAIP